MKKGKLFFSVLFLLLASISTVFATASTHIWAPSTDVQAYKKLHLTSDYYVSVKDTDANTRPAPITNLGLTIGILPFEKVNAEVGFDHKGGLPTDDNPFYFNAKIGVPENAYGNFFPSLAFGLYDLGTKKDETDSNVIYGKAGKTFGTVGRFSLGYFTGNEKLLLNSSLEKDNSGALICWEKTVTEISEKLWVAVEYQGSKSAYGSMNYGFSWKFSDNTSVIFAYDVYNNNDYPSTYTIQTDIDF